MILSLIVFIYCIINDFKQGESYIDCSNWVRSKKGTVNSINKKDNKCFQYTLNHERIKKDPQRIQNLNLS